MREKIIQIICPQAGSWVGSIFGLTSRGNVVMLDSENITKEIGSRKTTHTHYYWKRMDFGTTIFTEETKDTE